MRLIDADALTEEISEALKSIDNALYNFPTIEKKVDAVRCEDCKKVEVVRCKNCRRWLNGDDTYGTCRWNDYQTLQTRFDDYCSHAERND